MRGPSRLTDTRNPHTLNHLRTEPDFQALPGPALSDYAQSNEPILHRFGHLDSLDHHATTPRQ